MEVKPTKPHELGEDRPEVERLFSNATKKNLQETIDRLAVIYGEHGYGLGFTWFVITINLDPFQGHPAGIPCPDIDDAIQNAFLRLRTLEVASEGGEGWR